MKDTRRDATTELPPATIAELAAARARLAKRDTTLVGGALVSDDPRVPEQAARVLFQPPTTPLPRGTLEAALASQLGFFPEGCREAFLRAFSARSYVAAITLLDEAAALQPKNLSMTHAASAVRHFAVSRLEADLGGLAAVVHMRSPISTSDLPRPLAQMLMFIDGATTVEGIVRRSKVSRLTALAFLAEHARAGHLELLTRTTTPNPSLRLPPLPGSALALVEAAPKSGRTTDRPIDPSGGTRAEALRLDSPPPLDLLPDSLGDLDPPGEPGLDDHAPLERLELDMPVLDPLGGLVPRAAAAASPPQAGASPVFAIAEPPSTPPRQEPPAARSATLGAAPAPTPDASSQPAPATPLSPIQGARGLPHAAATATVPRSWLIAAGAVVALGAAALLWLGRQGAPEATHRAGRNPEEVWAVSTASPTPTQRVAATSPTGPATGADDATKPAETLALGQAITVRVKVEPDFARIALDGVLLTKSPVEVRIPKDGKPHELAIEANGFSSKKFAFDADADVNVIIALDKLPAGKPRASASAKPPP